MVGNPVEAGIRHRHRDRAEFAGIGAAAAVVGGDREHGEDFAAEELPGIQQFPLLPLVIDPLDAAGGEFDAIGLVFAAFRGGG